MRPGAKQSAGVVAAQPDARPQSPPTDTQRRVALLSAGLGLVALCAWLHLWRLSATPGWDPQEGYNLDLAWNLLHGRLRLFALTQDFAQHPPLFYLQLALFIKLFGYSIATARALVGLYATLTCAALLLVGRRVVGDGAALWAAAVYTLAPVILSNTRWAYSYHLLALVEVICAGLAWEALTQRDAVVARRWVWAAAVVAGLAALCDYTGVAWIAFVALVGLRGGWRRGALALALGGGVLLAGLLSVALVSPGVFFADVFATGGRAAGGDPITQTLLWLFNYERLLTYDAWLLLGVVGLFLVKQSRARGFLLGAAALLALITLKVRTLGPSFHTAAPLLPLLALGAGAALAAASAALFAWTPAWLEPLLRWWAGRPLGRAPAGGARGPAAASAASAPPSATPSATPSAAQAAQAAPLAVRVVRAMLVFIALVSPLAMAGASNVVGLAGTLTTPQDHLLAVPTDAQATITYTLGVARSGDLVLASPQIAWAFDQPDGPGGRPTGIEGADLAQALPYAGQTVAFYPGGLPRERWAYPVSLDHARYVIVDDLLRQLAAPDQTPALTPLLARVERWPVVYRRGQYTVYERPAQGG